MAFNQTKDSHNTRYLTNEIVSVYRPLTRKWEGMKLAEAKKAVEKRDAFISAPNKIVMACEAW